MKIIIKTGQAFMAAGFVSLLSFTSATAVYADTYVYLKADGMTLLTDKKIRKKGYKLQRTYKTKSSRKKRQRSNKGKPTRVRIGCGKLSPAAIDQKTRPYLHEIKKHAKTYGVEENLVRAIIRQESCFKLKAKSRVGAMGLMQLMPKTAEYLGIKNAWNSDQNIKGGVKYISRQLKRFKGDKRLALAAYNAGPGKVIKYNGIPPYRETRNYVASIMQEYKRLEKHRFTKKINSLSKKAKLSEDFHVFWGRK